MLHFTLCVCVCSGHANKKMRSFDKDKDMEKRSGCQLIREIWIDRVPQYFGSDGRAVKVGRLRQCLSFSHSDFACSSNPVSCEAETSFFIVTRSSKWQYQPRMSARYLAAEEGSRRNYARGSSD